MKKRIIALLLALSLCLCLTGCSNDVLTAAADAALETILAAVPEAAGREWVCRDISLDLGLADFTEEEAADFQYIWEEQADGTAELYIPAPMAGVANSLNLGGFTLKLTPDNLGEVKLAARDIFYQDTGEWPVLLLDDVLSELDESRQQFIARHAMGGQSIITCCQQPGQFEKANVISI